MSHGIQKLGVLQREAAADQLTRIVDVRRQKYIERRLVRKLLVEVARGAIGDADPDVRMLLAKIRRQIVEGELQVRRGGDAHFALSVFRRLAAYSQPSRIQ